ncbi:MAG: RNA polymerase sigma factor [Chloroflexales bacterium]|nr:RNA polymerase sigma factor [Chloroflexales bacterium]
MQETQQHIEPAHLEILFEAERARLVRLCASITGQRDAADDLAQETLIEAWRHRDRLTEPSGYAQWLSVIARNVCLRWLRRQRRERTTGLLLVEDGQVLGANAHDALADSFDLEIELERDELATLLDRALALLPAETRDVLVQKYVEDSPHSDIATRLGVSAGAVAMRLQRGKLALRRVLATAFRDEAAAYGLITADRAWEQTRIWRPRCGQARLLGRFDPQAGELQLCCPCCLPNANFFVVDATLPNVLHGIKGYKIAYTRTMTWVTNYLRPGFRQGSVPCLKCGAAAPLQRGWPVDAPPSIQMLRGVHALCRSCGRSVPASLNAFVFTHPAVQQFKRAHPRHCLRSEDEIDWHGRPAFVSRIESVTAPAGIDVVYAADTMEVLHIG